MSGRSRRGRRLRRRLGIALAGRVLAPVIDLLSRTWRIERIDPDHIDRHGSDFVACCWHGAMLMPIAAHRGGGHTVMVSPSGDGEIITRVLRWFGFGAVRGSSKEQGPAAVRGMLRVARDGGSLVVTPDGPRGPRRSVQDGAVWLAAATGRPLIPTGMACSRAWRLRSWDRFTVPKPFARIAIVYGEPLPVPRSIAAGETAAIAAELRARMIACERRACGHLGVAFDE